LDARSVKIVVADEMPASALESLSVEGWEIDSRSGRSPDELAADLQDADALIVRSATKVARWFIDAALCSRDRGAHRRGYRDGRAKAASPPRTRRGQQRLVAELDGLMPARRHIPPRTPR
jgi:hypothetical protein